MPFLEQRRRPPADPSLRTRRLILPFLRSTARNWPLCWAIVYLAGFGLGGRFPVAFPGAGSRGLVYPWVARGTAVLPALLAAGPGWLVLPVWLGVFSGGLAAGSLEAGRRVSRRSAAAESPTAVARALVWRGPAIVRITGWPAAAAKGKWRAPARLVHRGAPASNPDGLRPEAGQGIMLSGKGERPPPGTLLTGDLELRVPSPATLPGAFDYRLYLAGRGMTWQGRFQDWRALPDMDPVWWLGSRILNPLRRSIVGSIREFLPEREAGMAAAVLLGLRDRDSRLASRPFSELGLAHLFAVSGLHVGILLGIIVLPGRWAGWSPAVRLIPIMCLLPVYVLLTGMPGSVVRAASLGFLALLSAGLGRTARPLHLLGLLFWAGTVWDPAQDLDTGLKLSYLAAGGILAVSSLTNGLRLSRRKILGPVLTGLAVSASAQWFTLPLVAASFGRLSSLSLATNLVAVPVFGLAVWGVVLSLAAGHVWGAAGEWIGGLAWLLLRLLAGLAGFISRETGGFPVGMTPPGVGRILLWAVLTSLILTSLKYNLKKKHSRALARIALAGSLALGVAAFGPLSWDLKSGNRVTAWQFDVGQGDCALLVLPDGWSLLIDAGGVFGFGGSGMDGPVSRTVLPFLQRNGLAKMDGVVLTHGHLDHTGGARALGRALDVGTWYVSGKAGRGLSAFADTDAVHFPAAGQVLHRWRDWEIRVAYPRGRIDDSRDENDHSLVVVLSLADRDLAVWSGDLELEGEHDMLAGGTAPRGVQVWKAGHHGSNTSGSRELLDLLDPQLVLISCGVGNGYRHPSHGPYVVRGDTLAVARTDLQGSIRLEWDLAGELTWETMATGPQKIGLP